MNDFSLCGDEPTVGGLMSGCPVVVSKDEAIAGAAELLAGYDIGGLPVVDAEQRVVGVISQTDLVRFRGSSIPVAGWHGVLVRDLMTSPATTITQQSSLKDAAQLMTAERVHRLVVVDSDQVPVGVISQGDLVRQIADACDDG